MNLDIQITGLAELRKSLAQFSDRRFAAAIATALTRTARDIEQEWRAQMGAELDRPSARTVRGTVVQMAKADKLEARVAMRGDAGQVGTPAGWLRPVEFGGSRLTKRFEQVLQARGAMPRGTFAVPGDGAKLDRYGNVSRGQIIEALNQLGVDFSAGYSNVIARAAAKRAASAARSGRAYFVVRDQGKGLPPGIYYRDARRNLKAVFFFARGVGYRRTTTLIQRGARVGSQKLNEQVVRAVNEHIARLAARRGAS